MSAAEKIHEWMSSKKKTLALAESCTGGAMSAALTAIPGASVFFMGSLVVYANHLKQTLLSVSPDTLRQKGAVSRETVTEMLHGLFAVTGADYGIAVCGIAGPTGGTATAPIGTVWAAMGKNNATVHTCTFCFENCQRAEFIHKTTERLFVLLWDKLCRGEL